jgi:FkbM family methyltransferase
MFRTAGNFFQWSAPWRKEFGLLAGVRVALAVRRAIWGAPKNTRLQIEIPSLPHPIVLRAGTSDASVFLQVFGEHQASFPVRSDLSVIVDAGANIGLTTTVFATRFPHARVIALEIDPANFAILKENTRFYSNVEPLHKGLWTRRTRVRVANPEAESWAFRASEVEAMDSQSVEALGVADILADFDLPRIDLLKIDIEGGEYELFTGSVHDWVGRVETIAVEAHDRLHPNCSEVIRSALSPHGFRESRWAEYWLFTRDQ